MNTVSIRKTTSVILDFYTLLLQNTSLTETNYIEIDQKTLKIFDATLYPDEKLKALLNKLDRLEIIYRLNSGVSSTTQPIADTHIPRYSWVLKQAFSFETRNHLTLKLHTTKQMLPTPHLHLSQYVWIDFTVVFLSVVSMLLTFKYIIEVGVLYNDLRIQNAKQNYRKAYKQ